MEPTVVNIFGMDTVQMGAMVVASMEMFKRFIPKRFHDVVNPIVAVGASLLVSYFTAGTSGLLQGLLAGVGAVAAYKVPKMVGKKIGTVSVGGKD